MDGITVSGDLNLDARNKFVAINSLDCENDGKISFGKQAGSINTYDYDGPNGQIRVGITNNGNC